MMIRVQYRNGSYDMVKATLLHELLQRGRLERFRRSSGWALVGRDRLRGAGGGYSGPERRNSALH